MAKKKTDGGESGQNGATRARGGESVQGYFRGVFEENPKLLNTRSNDELLRRWLADHPGETEVPKTVKTGLSNLKSVLRSKGRKQNAASAVRPEAGERMERKASANAEIKSRLEALEEQIDDCLTLARGLDRAGLKEVISRLRGARNAVVWKMGQ